MKENQMDEGKFPVKKVQWFINQQKDEGIRPDDIDAGHNYFVKESLEVFVFCELKFASIGWARNRRCANP
jgi:DNA helicase-2/ATP-dependent DNA helicase PcrA